MSFGKRLKELREKASLTQEELGKKINLSKANISKYEAEIIQPSLETMIQIATMFNVSVDYLVGIIDEPNPYKQKSSSHSKDESEKKLMEKISTLSEESKKDLKKHIDLLKIRDSLESKDNETSSTSEEHA